MVDRSLKTLPFVNPQQLSLLLGTLFVVTAVSPVQALSRKLPGGQSCISTLDPRKMSAVQHIADVARQAIASGAAFTSSAAVAATSDAGPSACTVENDYDGRIGVRISAIFVILVGSTFGE